MLLFSVLFFGVQLIELVLSSTALSSADVISAINAAKAASDATLLLINAPNVPTPMDEVLFANSTAMSATLSVTAYISVFNYTKANNGPIPSDIVIAANIAYPVGNNTDPVVLVANAASMASGSFLYANNITTTAIASVLAQPSAVDLNSLVNITAGTVAIAQALADHSPPHLNDLSNAVVAAQVYVFSTFVSYKYLESIKAANLPSALTSFTDAINNAVSVVSDAVKILNNEDVIARPLLAVKFSLDNIGRSLITNSTVSNLGSEINMCVVNAARLVMNAQTLFSDADPLTLKNTYVIAKCSAQIAAADAAKATSKANFTQDSDSSNASIFLNQASFFSAQIAHDVATLYATKSLDVNYPDLYASQAALLTAQNLCQQAQRNIVFVPPTPVNSTSPIIVPVNNVI